MCVCAHMCVIDYVCVSVYNSLCNHINLSDSQNSKMIIPGMMYNLYIVGKFIRHESPEAATINNQ